MQASALPTPSTAAPSTTPHTATLTLLRRPPVVPTPSVQHRGFGDDTVYDPGAGTSGIVEDTAQFDNVGGTGTLADLEAISTTSDDGTDVTATIDHNGASGTFAGVGDGTIDTIVELDATPEIKVDVNA